MLVRITEQFIIWLVIVIALSVPVITFIQNHYFPVTVVTSEIVTKLPNGDHRLTMIIHKARWAPASICRYDGHTAHAKDDGVMYRLPIKVRSNFINRTVAPGSYAVGPWVLSTKDLPDVTSITIEFDHRCLHLFKFKSYADISLEGTKNG